MSSLSHFDPNVYRDHEDWAHRKQASPVRIQWDPERDLNSEPLPWRSLQVGIGGTAVERYIDDWIVELADITSELNSIRARASADTSGLPVESPYPVSSAIAATIGATNG